MFSDIRTADPLTQSVARCAYRSVVWTSNGPACQASRGVSPPLLHDGALLTRSRLTVETRERSHDLQGYGVQTELI